MTVAKKILPLAALAALVFPASAMAAPKSKFRFSQATYVTSEGQDIDVTVTRQARHGHSRINQTSSVTLAIAGGSATQGVDYTLAAGRLDFASGETAKTVTVHVAQDSDIEGLETIGLKLSAASNNALITQPRTSQVLIADDDGPTQVQLAPAAQSVNEGIGAAQFFAVRSGDITGSSSVHYATSDGSAVAPDDYASRSGNFTFATAEFSKEIDVPIVDDNDIENPETFGVTLSSLTGATFPNGAGSVSGTATIVDNDSPPIFRLDASSYEVNEDGSVDVTVQRLGNTAAPNPVSANDVFNVNWATSDGTATNPADYLPGADQQLEFDSTDDAETITIAANDADTQIGLVDDKLVEGDETFGLALTSAANANAPGGTSIQPSLGSPSSATVTIHDNDTPAGSGGGTPTGGTPGTNTGSQGGGQAVLGARQAGCGLVVKATKKQKLLKQKGLKLKLRSGQGCKVSLGTTIKQLRSKSKKRQAEIVRALRLTGKKASLTLQPGKAKTVKVKFTKKTLKAITKALQARKRLVATVVVTERDSASKVKHRTLRITIRR
jgi:Calx-beta domain